jgi:hypothetical protein
MAHVSLDTVDKSLRTFWAAHGCRIPNFFRPRVVDKARQNVITCSLPTSNIIVQKLLAWIRCDQLAPTSMPSIDGSPVALLSDGHRYPLELQPLNTALVVQVAMEQCQCLQKYKQNCNSPAAHGVSTPVISATTLYMWYAFWGENHNATIGTICSQLQWPNVNNCEYVVYLLARKLFGAEESTLYWEDKTAVVKLEAVGAIRCALVTLHIFLDGDV